MVKKKEFERFLVSYRNTDNFNLNWDDDYDSYASLDTQELYQFYSDIYEYDIYYKLAMIKTLVLCMVSVGLLLFSVICSVNIYNLFYAIFAPPINEAISTMISLIFLSVFIVGFILFVKKELAT